MWHFGHAPVWFVVFDGGKIRGFYVSLLSLTVWAMQIERQSSFFYASSMSFHLISFEMLFNAFMWVLTSCLRNTSLNQQWMAVVETRYSSRLIGYSTCIIILFSCGVYFPLPLLLLSFRENLVFFQSNKISNFGLGFIRPADL